MSSNGGRMIRDPHKALAKAWVWAEDYNDGSVVIQYLKNGEFLITHQMDQSSFPNVGGGWQGSADRILLRIDCRYYDKMYWEGQKHLEKNRLRPKDFEDDFYDLLTEMEANVEKLLQEEEALKL
jgi:hypothetical protein